MLISNDPKILLLSLVVGVVPALIWLWFWLREDNKKSEPRGLIGALFVMGMITVIFVIPIQKFFESSIFNETNQIIVWAAIEELVKYLAVFFLIANTRHIDEPLDWPIFTITVALGFAALENSLFVLKPFAVEDTTVALLTGHLRFLGATLLHAVSSGIIGVALGLSFWKNAKSKLIYLLLGIMLAVALHSAFNLLIMYSSGNNILRALGFLWVVSIVIMLIFEKLRRMSE